MADTIFAVSSGRPPAAIAVIRISGSGAAAAARALAGPLPPPRQAALRRLRHDGDVLDDALVLVFPAPNSATGDDTVELHCHGGRAVIAAVERALTALPGLRRGEAGEFTRRALTNGRIDLTEAQGLADLLAAETEAQRRAALGMAEGRLSGAVRGWMDRLTAMAAQAEAALDFADESDIDDVTLIGGLQDSMKKLAAEIDLVLVAPAVDRLRDGIRVVLAGPPNSGKSTLLNLLAERDVAIVSPAAGTTRDRIEVAVAHAGLPFVLTDTAGLRIAPADSVEQVGIERAQAAMKEADLVVWLGDAAPPVTDALWVHARADLPGRHALPSGRILSIRSDRPTTIMAMWALLDAAGRSLTPREDQLALDSRQQQRCRDASEWLAETWSDPLIGAELLRQAHAALAELLGVNATEAMLDALFGRFCIGK